MDVDTLDIGMEVTPGQIDRQLKVLWDAGDSKTRASLMNFAIYSEQPDSLAANTGVIAEVTREHACRALLIAVEPDAAETSLRSWITAHCQLAEGGKKSVCSEQITFLIRGRNPNALANTVFAHLDSDLPLTFWWQGGFSSNWEPQLYTVIDRLVVDSCEWADPLTEFDRVESAWKHQGSAFSVNDLTWTRVLPLRMAFAGAFDEPGALEHLAVCTDVIIHHSPGHAVAACMFAAWMLNQAKWTIVSATSPGVWTLDAGIRPVTLTFLETESCRAVPRVEVRSPRGVISLTREAETPFILTKVELPESSAERLTPCPCERPAELVIERLRRGCNTGLYFRLLKTVRVFLRGMS